jgi:hypothetical protein
MISAARRSQLLVAIELAFAALVIVVLAKAGAAMIRIWLMIALDAATALIPLLRVDGAATAWTVGLAIAKIALAVFPSLLLLRAVPRRRRTWLAPILGVLTIVSSIFSLGSCGTPARWVVLGAVSAAAAALVSVRYLRWVAVLPLFILWEPVPGHGLAAQRSADATYRAALLNACAQHDGTRPANLSADLLMPYYGITAVDDDLLLLTALGPADGEMRGNSGGRLVGSWWLRRHDGAFHFDAPSRANGNLWRGCVLDGTVWAARANLLVGAERLAGAPPHHEEVIHRTIPAEEIDFSQTACDAARHRIYVSEAYKGGTWEVEPGGGEPRRHEIGGGGLWPKRRFDGQLVLTNTASIVVFAPDEDRVLERVPAAVVSIGSDVCEHDGAVAVADLLGRVRVFTLGADGHYRFAWGVPAFGARRVAFSRDCSRIAATSADDERVFIIDAATHAIADVHRAGPALRDVAATGDREFSVADACSLTTYRW